MGKRRYPKEKDRVLRFAVVAVLFLFATGFPAISLMPIAMNSVEGAAPTA